MKQSKKCPECGRSNIYMGIVSAGSQQEVLPGAIPWYKVAKLEVYVCTDCGFYQHFVPAELLAGVRESKKFKSIR